MRNVRFRHGDGSAGLEEHRRRSMASWSRRRRSSVPEALLKQLQVGGRLIVPVGPEGEQELIRFTRREERAWNGAIAGAGGASCRCWAARADEVNFTLSI